MTGIWKLGLCSIAAGTLALTGSIAQAQSGEAVYKKKGCAACHNISKAGEEHRRPGGKQAGPDLAGVTERRDRDWLRRWLKDPNAMLQSDPTAIALMAEAKNLKMPNMKLTDAEIEALIDYLAVKQ
jgi:protein SCO1